jgi:hypothetical protein
MEHGTARHSARAEERDLLGSASQRGLQRTLQQKKTSSGGGRMGSSHRHTAAREGSVQQRLQRSVARIFASVGPEGARGHEAAGWEGRGGQGGAECEVAVHTTFQLCGSFRQGEVLQNGLLLHPRDPRILSSEPPPPPPATTCPTGAHGTVLEQHSSTPHHHPHRHHHATRPA